MLCPALSARRFCFAPEVFTQQEGGRNSLQTTNKTHPTNMETLLKRTCVALSTPSPCPFCITGKRLHAKAVSNPTALQLSLRIKGSLNFGRRPWLSPFSSLPLQIRHRQLPAIKDIFQLSLQQMSHFRRLTQHSYRFASARGFIVFFVSYP